MKLIVRILLFWCICAGGGWEAVASDGGGVWTFRGERAGGGGVPPAGMATAQVKAGGAVKEKTVCAGEAVEMTVEVSGTTTFTAAWRKMGREDTLQKNAQALRLEGGEADAGRYYCELVDQADGDRRFYSDTLTLTVHSFRVTIQAPSAERAVCRGDSLVLTAGGEAATTYGWAGVGIVGEPSAASVKVKFADNGKFVLDAEKAGCRSSDTIRYDVQTFRARIEPPSAEREVCRNDELQLSVAWEGRSGLGMPSYVWAGDGLQLPATNHKVKVKFADNGKFVVTASLGACSARDSVTYRVHHLKTAIFPPLTLQVCNRDTVVLHSVYGKPQVAGDTLFHWTGEEIVGANNRDSVRIILKSDGVVKLKSSTAYCVDSATISFAVNSFRGRIQAPSPERRVCRGDSLELSAMGTVATATYRWEGAGMVGTDRTAAAVKVKFADNGRFVLKSTDGTCQDVDSIRYQIETLSAKIVTPSAERTICRNASLDLRSEVSASETGTVVYRWMGEGMQGATDNAAVNVLVGENGKYKLQASLSKCRATDSVVYTVNHHEVGIVAPADAKVCYGDTVVVCATHSCKTTDTTYLWEAAEIIGRKDLSSVKVVLTKDGSVRLNSTAFGCTASASYPFTVVHYEPKIVVRTAEREVCHGSELLLMASNAGSVGSGFSWEWSGQGVVSPQASSTSVKFGENGKFVLRFSDGRCVEKDSILFTVRKYEVKIETEKALAERCWLDTLTLSASNRQATPVGATYAWKGSGITSNASASQVKLLLKENPMFTLRASDGKCYAEDTIRFSIHHYQVGIEPLAGGSEVCFGGEVVLKPTDFASQPLGGSYVWSGEGLTGSGQVVEARFKIGEQAVYALKAFDGTCYIYDTLRLNVQKYTTAIRVPTTGKVVCFEDELTLSTTAQPIPAGAQFTWSGAGIVGATDQPTVTVKLTDNGTYRLQTQAGVCRVEDEITFQIRKYQVNVTNSMTLANPQNVTINVTKVPNSVLDWYVDGVKKITGSTADYAVFYIDKDSRVMVQMTVQPENCVSRDICDVRIGVKDARKYQGGAADGFSLARPSLRLWKKDTAVCVYTPLRAQLVDFIYPTYYFEWYKVGEESKPPVCQTKDLLIPRCRMEDAGNYYCRVKDVDGSGYIYSDTLALTVKDGPIAKIVVPSGGTELCYRQSLTLEAVSKNSAYQYEWNGADIEGGRLSSDLEIRPRQSGLYVLKISDVLGCSSVDSIRVGVREALKLDLPEQWSLAQPGALSLTAWSNRPNLSLNWKWEGKRQSGGHTMNLSLTKAGVVSVSLEDGKCAVSDSCRVDIKQVTTFRGGESDGFEESVPVLKVMEKVMVRCTGEQAVLKVGGMNYPNCEYKWYRADDATVAVGSGRTYTIAFCELVHSGLYFCQANRGSEPIWNSDTVSLTVNQGAVAKIVKDPAGMTACYGVQKTLTAEVVDGNYEWSGAGILGGRLSSNLVLLPRKSGIYTLRVTRGECSTSDSVALKVIHPFVRIPDLLQLPAGQEVTMNAERSHPDTLVKWSVNNVYQLTSNKSVALSIAGSGLVVAEVTEQGCQASDTMQVFVKGGSTFTAGGGGNDGFAVSRALLRVKVKELTPCETSDVLMALQDDNVGYHSYTWYKVGELAAVGQGMSYAILRCTAGYNGQYYCRAESADAAGYSYSDTLSLQVKPGVATTIISPTKGTGLCYGEEVIFQAQPQGSGYTYHWTGAGIVEGGDSPIVTVKVEKAGQMRLDMTYNGCESMDTVSFTVTRPEVALQKTMLLSAPQSGVMFKAVTTAGTFVQWYINKAHAQTSQDPVSLTIPGSCRVIAQIEENSCVDSAVCDVFVKGKNIFDGGGNDGFAESKPGLTVQDERLVVCRGSEAVLAVKDLGYGNYSYKWFKDTDDKHPVWIGREYVIPECTTEEGMYFCRVLNPDATGTDTSWISKKVSLTITKGPLARMISSVGEEVCYEQEVVLDALTKTQESSQTGDLFAYLWKGPEVDGLTTGKVTIHPRVSGVYGVTVSDVRTGCSDTVSMGLRVNRLAVEIPSHLSLPAATAYRFEAYNPQGATLTWYIDEAVQSGELLSLQKNCTVKVKAEKGGCTEFDSCVVFVRNEQSYATRGGEEDGFTTSVTVPRMYVFPKDTAVCNANPLRLRLKVMGDGLYKYYWYRVGSQQVLTEDAEYVIPSVTANAAGQYYCRVANLLEPSEAKRMIWSDTATVTFREGPKAIIGSPMKGAEVCDGVEVTLDASKSEEGKVNPSYTYKWSGAGAEGMTGKSITFIPKGEKYRVEVSEQGNTCSSIDTITLKMSRPQIFLPEQIHLSASQVIKLEPKKQAGSTLNWYINTDRQLTNADVASLDLKTDCQVIVEMVVPVSGGTCSGFDTAFVYIKSPATFRAGTGGDDGFAGTLPRVSIRQEEGNVTFCRGTDIFRTLKKTLSERLMEYEWRKMGDLKVVSNQKDLVIPKCALSDSGRYYCMGIDVAETDLLKKVFYSDTVKLTIKPGPLAQISSPVEGATVCYQMVLDLDASQTEMTKYPYTDNYEYEWKGSGVESPTLYHTKAFPSVSGEYVLRVTNGTCTTYDTASVTVNAPAVSIRRTLYANRLGYVKFMVENPKKNVVNWYQDNKPVVSGKDTADVHIYDDCKIVVEMEEKGCSKTDTCFVFLKDPRSFVADGSDKANEDGFYASGTSFYIKKVVSTELVCEGATSVFTIEVVGNDFYRYAWKKKGNLAILSNENVYRIETTHLDNAGDYYCEVTDVSNNKTQVSATVPLEVIRLPKTKILAASHRICEGESLEMRADSTLLIAGRSYTYLWTGTGVSNSRQKGITVVPSASGAYVLTISDANCFMKDTLEVEVVKGALKLKKVYSIKEGEDISIRAEVLAGMKVNWRVDGILYREVNPLVLNGLKKSVDYTVETSGVCSEQQTGHLFVRSNAGYIGGDEDGFTMPNGLPQIIDQSPEIVGCGKDTASLWVEVLKKEEVKPDGYIWQKYNEVAQDFVNFTPGLPEGHVTGLKTEKIHFSVITAEDEGRFRCRIMGGQGLVDSREINLVKGDVPRIDGKMNDVHQCERTPILFMVSASVKNGKDPNYRWYYSATPNNFRQLLPEQDLNKTFYQINQSAKSDEGYYEVEAYNLCGRVYDTAYLEIWQKPNVAKQNADTSVCLDGSVQLWMEAGGGGHYGYSLIQVETDHNGHYVKDKRVVYSGLEPWYNLPVAGTIDRGYFVWKVWNDCDTTRGTKLFYLDVQDPPIVHYTSVDTTLCIGTSTLVLDAHQNVASPLPTTRYYWTKNGEKISQITAIHTIHSFTHSDTGVYKCYVYNACQAQLMKEFRVHKKEVPLVTLQVSAATSYCEGEAVQLNVKYSSDAGEVQPEWMFNGNLMSDAAPHIVGTHTDTLTMDSLTAAQIGTYSIKLTNGCGYNLSNEVKLMVDMPARFLASGRLEGKDQYLCLGDQTAFVVTASGKESIQYTWTKNHVVIPGERTARLTLNNVNAASAALYECYIQNICNIESESTGASLSILTPGVFTLLGGGKYCGYEDGRNVTLSGFEKTAEYHLFRYAANGSSVLVKTISGASVAEGGTLSFGSMPYGTYYVKATAGNAGKVCESVMKGEIEIIRDITPLQYDFVVSDPICTGGTNGSLTLKGSENDKNIVYHLQRQALADEWVYYGSEIPGNGGALKWGNLVSGVYRVMATSKISGCMMQIGATDTLIERPYPQVFALTALNGDTTDCQGMVADVVLQLSGAEKNCSYTLFKDDVATDRTLVGTSIVWDQVVGTSIGAKYTVLAKTSYGCTQEMGKVTVVEKTAPRPLWLSGDGYFCSGDSGKQKIMIEGNTESGVRYDIYNQKTLQKLTDTLLYGTGKAIVFGLPKLPCAYRVEGVDTLDGCVSAMERMIEIKEDSLKIMPIADQYIHIGTSTQLHADIRQAVGAYSVLWQPADKFALNGNTVAHPTTVALQHAQRFVVQASDANCTVEAFAEVRFLDGEEEIYTEINLSDCLTVQDTLRLCEGEKVTLCSWTSGGTPPYTCTWREPGKSKQSIGTGNRLTDYQMTVSGYIELEVRSDVGQEVKDSIWIEFEKNPRNDLALTHSGLNCARLGETVDFVLKTAEKDVKYTLEYSKDGKRYAETKTTVIGSGIDLPFYLPYADDTVGYYRFKAEKVYKSHTCHTEFNAVELRLRPQRFEINSVGPTEYCADRHRDTIRLAQSENGVTYRLVNTATKKTIQVAEGAGSSILYENYFGSGRYRVVAQLGVCQDTMTGVVNINALPRPLIGKLGWQGVYCLNSGGINPTVRVEKTIRGVVYTLYRDSVNFREQMGQGSGDGQNFLDLGELNKPGNYWVSSLGVAPNGCTDTVRGMSVVNTPQPVKLVESKGMYCYGEGALSDTLKIYAIDPLVVYELEDLNRKVVGVFGNQQKDTLYCPVSLAGGKYYIWPKMSSCRSVLGMYEVVEHKRMTDKELMLPLTECEGYPLNMGVKLSEPGVLYELYENVNGVENKLAEGMGNGRDLIIKTYDRPGIYSITAVDPLAGCSHRLPGEYQIGGAPTKFDILASAVEYCAEDAGVVLGISGTQANVNYQLQQWEAAAAAFVNVSSSAVIFGTGVAVEQVFSGKYKAGKYRIVSESCHQVVMNGEVNISEIPKPTDILVNMKGNACVDSTISLALTPTEVGVKYVLYHNNLYTGSDTLTGNGGDQSWNVPLAKAGVYSVSAIRKECIYPLTRKAEIGVVTKLVDLSGWEPLCANLTKTLSLLNAELTSEYKLWGSQKDTLFTGVINGQHIDFSGVLPGDIYYVKARNQMCEIKSKAYEFKAKELPVVKKENFVIKDCSGTGKGDILLKGLRKEYAYRLVGQNLDVLLMQREKDTLFVDKQAGEYVLTVTNTQTQCELEPIRKTVRRALPSDSVLMPLVYCAGGEGVNIPLSGSSYNVQYSMLSIAEAALETFKAPVKVFTRKYTNGQYVFKKENLGLNGGCISLDTITVEELPIPSVNFPIQQGDGGVMCEVGNNRIILKGSQVGVNYVLCRDKKFYEDTLVGTGGELVFRKRKSAGIYEISARHSGLCEAVFADRIKISPVPGQVKAIDGVYCYNPAATGTERGASIAVSLLDPKAKYYLQQENLKYDSITSLNSGAFKISPVGNYAITGIYPATGCWDTVGKVRIREIGLPDVFPVVNTIGSNCDTRARIRLNGSQGDSVEYTLYMNQLFVVSGPVRGTGGILEFAEINAAGTYEVYANRVGSECGTWMSGKVVIASEAPVALFEVRGTYCEGSKDARVKLALLNAVKGWSYFVSWGDKNSKTIQATDDPLITWDTVGNKSISGGVYLLKGMNECGEVRELATVEVKAALGPEHFKVLEGKRYICQDSMDLNKHIPLELMLSGSQQQVEYNLGYDDKEGNWVPNLLPKSIAGTGSKLNLGSYRGKGIYYVRATIQATGCSAIIDTVELIAPLDMYDPIVTTKDTCIVSGEIASVTVRIQQRKQPYVNYYLRVNGVPVDTLSRWAPSDVTTFKPQQRLGQYDIIAENKEKCRLYIRGPLLGEKPDVSILIEGEQLVSICSGDSLAIRINRTQIGNKYCLVKDKTEGVFLTNVDGGPLTLGQVKTAGIYRVRALASDQCNELLDDSVALTVLLRPTLEVEQDLGYCAKGKGVELIVKNTVLSDATVNPPGVDYTLYQVVSDQKRYLIDQPGTGGNLIFKNENNTTFFLSGLYSIVAKDRAIKNCPTEKSINVREIALPQKYKLKLEGSAYMCEYPEVRSLTLSSSQEEVEYALYRRNKPTELAAPIQIGTGKMLTFQVQDTGVYYMTARSVVGDKCESEMLNEVKIAVPTPLKVFNLESVRASYCSEGIKAEKTPSGAVKLNGTESNVIYKLFRNGVAVGMNFEGNGGAQKWSGLEGKYYANAAGGDLDGYIYTVTATHKETGCSKPMTGQVSIIAEGLVSVSIQTPDQDVCMGSNLRLTIDAKGGVLNYEWMKENQGIVGLKRYYAIDSVTNADVGSYRCKVSNQCSEYTAAPILIKVRAVVIQDKPMADVLICEEPADVAIPSTVIAEEYRWKKVGSDRLLSSERILKLNNVRSDAAGLYVCNAFTSCGGLYDTCRLEFNRHPEVVWKGTVKKTLCVGSAYTLELESRDTVDWFLNGKKLNVRGNKYEIGNLQRVDSGLYSVVAKNLCSSSADIPLQNIYVDQPIKVIEVTDSLKHYCKNSDIRLTIRTNPSQRVTYKWYRANNYVGESGNTFGPITATIAENNINYFVRYSNACSDPLKPMQRGMTIRIDEPVVYQKLGAETMLCAEKDKWTEFRLKQADLEGESYQWYYRPLKETAEKVLAVDSCVLSLPQDRNVAGYYYCKLSNACGSAFTDTTKVQVDSIPVIWGDLRDTTICENSSLTFKLKAKGGNLTYRWMKQLKGSSTVEYPNIFKADGFESESTMTLKDFTPQDDSCRLWCEVSNHCQAIYSDTAVVRVIPNARVRFEESSVRFCEGGEARTVVKLEYGVLPSVYRYTLNDGTPQLRELAKQMTDTLVLKTAGIYKLISLTGNAGGCVESTPTSVLTATYYDRFTATLSGNSEGCIGMDAELTVTIDKGQGPWAVELIRESDQQPAVEIGEYPMLLNSSVTTLRFKPMKNERYWIRRIVETGVGCEGIIAPTTGGVIVHLPDRVSFSSLSTDVFGGCQVVDFATLLKPTVAGGAYYVNNQISTNTLLAYTPGAYRIKYVTTTAYNCMDSAVVVFHRDTLPVVSISSGDNLCPGESTDLVIHTAGDAPLQLTINMKEIDLNGRESFYNNLRKMADAKGNCTYNVFNNNNIHTRTYEVIAVRDKYGCGLDPAVPNVKKVVTMRERPVMKVETRHNLYNGGLWTSDIRDFVIPQLGTVSFRVTELSGGNPWTLTVLKTLKGNTTTETYTYKEQVATYNNAAEGTYQFSIADNYCRIPEELVETRKVSYTETGFLRVKVFLQGAYSTASKQMESQISALLPLKGMDKMPILEGGKQIIDWVVMELRKEPDGAAVVRDTLLLRDDGYVINRNGKDLLAVIGENFSLLEGNAYHIVIKHRNHLTIASRKFIIFTEPERAELIDLSNPQNIYTKDADLGRHTKELDVVDGNHIWGMAVGNILNNSLITIANPTEIQYRNTQTKKGYYLYDVNFDGMVKWQVNMIDVNGITEDPTDDAFVVYRNRNYFSEIPEN